MCETENDNEKKKKKKEKFVGHTQIMKTLLYERNIKSKIHLLKRQSEISM